MGRKGFTLRNMSGERLVPIKRMGHAVTVRDYRVDLINSVFTEIMVEMAHGEEVEAEYVWLSDPERHAARHTEARRITIGRA